MNKIIVETTNAITNCDNAYLFELSEYQLGWIFAEYIQSKNYKHIEYLFSLRKYPPQTMHNVIGDGRDMYIIEYVCMVGDIPIFELFVDNGFKIIGKVLKHAVRGTNYDVAEYLLINNIVSVDNECFVIACEQNDVSIVKLLLDYGADATDHNAMYSAICNCNHPLIKLLVDAGYVTSIETFDKMMISGCHPDCFQLVVNLCDNFDEIATTIVTTYRIRSVSLFNWFDKDSGIKTDSKPYLKIILDHIQDEQLLTQALYKSMINIDSVAQMLYKYGANIDGLEGWVRKELVGKNEINLLLILFFNVY